MISDVKTPSHSSFLEGALSCSLTIESDPEMRKPPYVTQPIVCRRNTIFDPTAKAIMSYQGTQVSTMEDLTMLWSIMANKMEC